MYDVFYGQHWLKARRKQFPTKALAMQFARAAFDAGGDVDAIVRFAWEIGGAVAFGYSRSVSRCAVRRSRA